MSKIKERNKIVIDYKPDERGQFGFDCINIDVKNTSFGALRTFQKDLTKLSEEWRERNNQCWHPVTAAYVDLLEKISTDLKTKLSIAKS